MEVVSQRLLADEEGTSRQRNWLRLIAELPVVSRGPSLSLPQRGARRSFDAVHGNHADLKAVLAEWVVAAAHLELRGDGENRLGPLPLVGPPGIGKSTIARALVDVLRRPCEVVSAPLAAGDDCYLVGAGRIWTSAEPGAVIRAVWRAVTSRLLMVLDEIGRAGVRSRRGTSPTAWLLDLLGSDGWADRYVGVPYPTSTMSFGATATRSTRSPPRCWTAVRWVRSRA